MIFAALGAAIGTLLASLRCHFLLLTLASAFFAIVVTCLSLMLGRSLEMSALVGFGSIAAVQASYLALGLALEPVRSENFMPEVQAAIGQQLRAELEVQQDLPPNMARLVLQLKAA